ncbi:MAG: KH domain-containing protein [Elusimicrobiaceae bacterium]|nr:KH domain-containing protein [Elusimicrobiaceae bacterium]
MKELAEYLLKALVLKPEEVAVSASEDDKGVVRVKAHVAESDKGKVIGKDGRVIKAVRAVMSAGAAKAGRKVFLDLD